MKYMTHKGQTWDYVAYQTTGEEMAMDAIISANEYYYSDVITFDDGDILNIPDVVIQEVAVIPSPWG